MKEKTLLGFKLKPCPYCGKTRPLAVTTSHLSGVEDEGVLLSFAIVCDYRLRGCGAVSGHRQTLKSAKKAWNQRK